MITLNGRTKLTTQAEKRLVELGGENPLRTLTQEQLASAMLKGLAEMARQRRTRTLEKLYLSNRRDDASLPSLENSREQDGGAGRASRATAARLRVAPRPDQPAAALSFLSVRTFIFRLAGLAANQRSSLVNGSTPLRLGLAATACAVILSRPGSVK